jgi:hypothetical protein
MKSILKTGKITTYKNTENTIQYRGIKTPLYTYETLHGFKKKDVYWGLNKQATADNIVCRIMPIIHDSLLKYIAIYLKPSV